MVSEGPEISPSMVQVMQGQEGGVASLALICLALETRPSSFLLHSLSFLKAWTSAVAFPWNQPSVDVCSSTSSNGVNENENYRDQPCPGSVNLGKDQLNFALPGAQGGTLLSESGDSAQIPEAA